MFPSTNLKIGTYDGNLFVVLEYV